MGSKIQQTSNFKGTMEDADTLRKKGKKKDISQVFIWQE